MSQEGKIAFAKTCRILVGLLHNAIEVAKTSPPEKFSCVKNWKLDAVLETIGQMWEQESFTNIQTETKEKEKGKLPDKEESKKEQTKKETPNKESVKKDSKIDSNKEKERKTKDERDKKEESENKGKDKDKDKEKDKEKDKDKDKDKEKDKDEKKDGNEFKDAEKPLDHRKILMQSHLQIQIQNTLTMPITKAPEKTYGLDYILMKAKISVFKICIIFRLYNFSAISLMTLI